MALRSPQRKPIYTFIFSFSLFFFIIAFSSMPLDVRAAELPSDDFQDGEMAELWSLNVSNSNKVWLDETNGKLEGRASGICDDDAYYISNGWWLWTSNDFAIQIDYHHSSTIGESQAFLALIFPGTEENNIAISVVYDEDCEGDSVFAIDGNTAGVELPWNPIKRSATDGILYISYDADSDKLHISINGYWQPENSVNGDWVYEDLVQDSWNADKLSVVFGLFAQNTIGSGEVWFDNFQVLEGNIIYAEASPRTVAPISVLLLDSDSSEDNILDGVWKVISKREACGGDEVFVSSPFDSDGIIYNYYYQINNIFQGYMDVSEFPAQYSYEPGIYYCSNWMVNHSSAININSTLNGDGTTVTFEKDGNQLIVYMKYDHEPNCIDTYVCSKVDPSLIAGAIDSCAIMEDID